jgi:hypothetical protein
LFKKFGKTKQSEVNLLKILQDRSKTNVFVPNCLKEEKRKNEASFFLNEYNRSSTIEDLPLLVTSLVTSVLIDSNEILKSFFDETGLAAPPHLRLFGQMRRNQKIGEKPDELSVPVVVYT